MGISRVFLKFAFAVFFTALNLPFGDVAQAKAESNLSEAKLAGGSASFGAIKWTRIKTHKQIPEIKIPGSLWDILENKKEFHKGGLEEVQAKDGSISIQNVFNLMVVRLKEKDSNMPVLGGENFEIISGRSGAFVDLADYIKSDSGTFNFSFHWEKKEEPDKRLVRIFYLSGAKRRLVDGQVLGAGCNKYMEITGLYFKKILSETFEVNVTRKRHVSLLAGVYLFVINPDTGGGIRTILPLVVTDSSAKELLCDAFLPPQKT